MFDIKYPEGMLNLKNIGIYGSITKLDYHELTQKLYDAIEYGYIRGNQDASIATKSDAVEWTNFTELVNGKESHKIDYTKLDGRKVKIVDDEGVFSLQTALYIMVSSLSPDTFYSYKLVGYGDFNELLRRAWNGTNGLTLYIEGYILKEQRTADKLVVGERVSLRSILTHEVWRDAVCVAPGSIVGYSCTSEGLELLDEDLENIIVEEELGVFDISSVTS